MNQLHAVRAQLGAIGRCALVGMLVGMLATQTVAEGATAVTPKTPAKPETTSAPSGSPEQINLATTANLPLAAQDSATADVNTLPDAPASAPAGTSDSASLTMPPELKAMMDDAQQNSQNLQSAPSTKSHGLQRPGMLVMGIVGIPLIGFGTYVMTRSVSKDAGLKNAFGAAFLVPGAAMSAIGFTFAFKPKH
jgi:hypothetical protein